jgi:hypothetical protein
MSDGKIVFASTPSVIAGGGSNIDWPYPAYIEATITGGSMAAAPGTYSGVYMRFAPSLESNGGSPPVEKVFDFGPFIMNSPGTLKAFTFNDPTAPITFNYTEVSRGRDGSRAAARRKDLYQFTMPEVAAGRTMITPAGAIAIRFSLRPANLVLAAPFPTTIPVDFDYFGFAVSHTITADVWQPVTGVRSVTPPAGFPGTVRAVWLISVFCETAAI